MNTNEVEKSQVVLIGKNKKILDLITFTFQTNYNFEIIQLKNIVEALEFFSSPKNIHLVLVDYKMGSKEFTNVIKSFSDSKLKVPFIGLGVPESFKKSGENRELVHAFVSSSNFINELDDVVKELFFEDTTKEPEEFCPVQFSVLTIFEGIETDIYIQLLSGRFLKLYSENDDITNDDVDKFSKKGVETLFLKKRVCNWLLRALNENLEKVVEGLEKGKDVKLTPTEPPPTLNSEDQNDKIDKIFEFDKEMQKEVQSKIKKTLQQVKKVPTLAKLLKKIQVSRDPENYYKNHVNLLCKITTALCHLMDWRQESTIEKMVFVSYLHDITLVDYPHLARIQTVEELDKLEGVTEKERKLYLNHPEDVRAIVEKMPEAPVEANTIIYQHHETSDGTGFPNNHQTNRLLPLSCLFIIAHDLVSYIMSDPNWNLSKFSTDCKAKYSGSNFNKIVRKLDQLKI